MARPRSFDADKALDAATALFWERGYDGAGLSDLLDVMGIQRGSLYKAWGSKKGLFLACLDRYDETHVAPGIAVLEGQGAAAGLSGADRIEAVFQSHDTRGCLLCNSAAGIAGTDAEIAAAVTGRLDHLTRAFATALRATGLDADAATAEAEKLMLQYMGMRVRHRAAP